MLLNINVEFTTPSCSATTSVLQLTIFGDEVVRSKLRPLDM